MTTTKLLKANLVVTNYKTIAKSISGFRPFMRFRRLCTSGLIAYWWLQVLHR